MSLPKPCLEWEKSRTRAGYGNTCRNGKVVYVHRIEWEKHNGKIPDGLCVLHKCDNPPCYEITHLFLGTRAENMADKVRKGRNKNPNQRISNAQALEIRERFKRGEHPKTLAVEYGCGYKNIQCIVYRMSFKNI